MYIYIFIIYIYIYRYVSFDISTNVFECIYINVCMSTYDTTKLIVYMYKKHVELVSFSQCP